MATSADSFVIRPATAADTDALFDICLKTADSGRDGSALFSDPRLPGYVWAVPYLTFAPAFAFVLANADRAVGYVLAAPDTAAFEERLKTEWWPRVRREIAGLQPSRPLDDFVLPRILHPEDYSDRGLAAYPAHMHINLLPPVQSSGWGRRMIETELAALRAHGVAGVCLGVSPDNQQAKGFYLHLGFEDISSDGNVTFGMKLTE